MYQTAHLFLFFPFPFILFLAGAAAVVAGNTTVLNAPPPAADAPVVIYGDYLDRKLQKRVQNLIGEIALLQTSIVEFYTDLHKTSNDYNNDDAIAQQGNQRAGFVEINNRKIPVLQKLRAAGLIGKDKDKENASKSHLLMQMQTIINKLENTLTKGEEDILRVVVLHHKLRKNF